MAGWVEGMPIDGAALFRLTPTEGCTSNGGPAPDSHRHILSPGSIRALCASSEVHSCTFSAVSALGCGALLLLGALRAALVDGTASA